jgi:hypothetical protein
MKRKNLAIVGLIGAILMLVGVFTPWTSASGSGEMMGISYSVSVSASGWNITQGEVSMTGEVAGMSVTETVPVGESANYPYIALAGGVLALVGALGVLASPGKRILLAILVIGGLLAIIGAGLGFADIETGSETITYSGTSMAATASYGFGLYLCVVGGILGLINVLGFKAE